MNGTPASSPADPAASRRRLGADVTVAWIAVATHVVASAAMLFLLRKGLPPASDSQRIAYITSHGAAWTCGWFTWQLTIVSLIAFYAVLAKRLGGPLPVAALALGTAGAAIDIATNVRYIVILPRLGGDAFALLDRELEVMTGYAANGLYTLAFVLFAIAGRSELPRLANALAWPVAASGFALALGALLQDWRTEMISSAILFPLFTLWTILIARWLRSD